MSLDRADEIYMARALELAKRGAGWVDPNPMVGCVITDPFGGVIGEGWHKAFGSPHAEREALADCEARGACPAGATAYVTLEPCCHWGKTPPCTDALIEAGVARVVVGCIDENPLVASAGCAQLESAGIDVEVGVLEERCRALNRAFFHYAKTGRPYVIAKYAMTLDGRIATHTGRSTWVTGDAARRHVHESRGCYAAVMVGIGTVLADDPLLNCRLDVGADIKMETAGVGAVTEQERGCVQRQVHQPVRIVCDAHLRTPLDSQLVQTAQEIPLVIAVSENIPSDRLRPYTDAGCTIVRIPCDGGKLDLEALMAELGKMQLDSVYVEGGPTLLGSLLDAGLIDYVQAYIAPKLFGGAGAPAAIAGTGVECPQNAVRVVDPQFRCIGEDLLVEGKVEYA